MSLEEGGERGKTVAGQWQGGLQVCSTSPNLRGGMMAQDQGKGDTRGRKQGIGRKRGKRV